MMSDFNIGIGFALDGEREFKEAIKDVNAQMRLLASQAKLTEAEYAGNANSLEALTKKHGILERQLEAAAKKVQMNREQMEAWQGVSQRAGEKVEDLRQRIADAKEEMEKMQSSSVTTAEEIDKQSSRVKELNEALAGAENEYERAGRKATNYQTDMTKAEAEVSRLNNSLKQNERNLAEAEKSTDGLAVSIDAYGKEVKDASSYTSVFGDVMKANLASEAITAGIEKIVSGIKQISTAMVGTGAGFEASMSQVAATMGITAEEIAQGSKAYEILEKAASDCGKNTKYSASESAEALNYLALAGYDAEKAAAVLPKVLNLAAAGGMDLATASDMVTDSMAALNLEVSQLDIYMDEMARTAQKSNTSVSQLGEATIVCAGTVTMTQQSLETMNAELGILANNGIKGAEGGTHLRNVLLSLVTPTKEGADALEELNVKVSDSQGNVRDLNDILTDMNEALSDMSAADRTNVISRIFNKTDIASVNALLKGTGQEFDSLYRELVDCSGAAADMAKTMNANLTGKVTILNSALEALGNTAYKKIEGTLKKSVEAATDSVGRLQMSMDKGELGEAIDNFSESLGEAAESAIGFAEDALPVVIDGLSWILDHSDLVISGIAGIAAAEVYHGTVAPMITAVSEAWHAYKVKTEGATVSQWLLNAAMDANPAGILLTAIVGLTAAVAVFSIAAQDSVEWMDETTRATRELIEESQTLNDAYVSSSTARKEIRESQELETAACRRLAEELKDLQVKTNLSVEEQARMKTIVAELNEAIPNLNLAIDEQTGLLNMSADAIEKNVESMMKLAMVEAAKEDLAEIAKERYEAYKEMLKLQEQLKEQTLSLAETTYKLIDTRAEVDAMNASWKEQEIIMGLARAEARETSEAYQELEGQLAVTEQAYDDLGLEYMSVSEFIEGQEALLKAAEEAEKLSDEMDGAAQSTVYYRDTLYLLKEPTDAVVEQITSLQTVYAEAKTAAEESITSQVGLFDELSVKSEMTTGQMIANIQSQTETYNTYAQDLQTAADLVKRGLLDEGMLGAIEAMGIDGAGYLHELVTAAEEDTGALSDLMEAWAEMSVAKDTLSGAMADIETGYTNSMDAILGISEDRTEQIQGTMEDAEKQIQTDAENALDTLDKTVATEGEDVTATAVQVAEDTISGVESVLEIQGGKSLKFFTIGQAIDQGMAEGILAGKSEVISAASSVAAAAFLAAKSELDINSPSKKFEWLAEMSVQGYSDKMYEGIKRVKDTLHETMDEMLDYNYPPGQGGMETAEETSSVWKKYEIQQEINIYSMTDDPIEAAKKFKDSQREAAEEW